MNSTPSRSLRHVLGLDHEVLPVVRVVVAEALGSTPREAGAAMIVTAGTTAGTIGGGQLEWRAIAAARRMLAEPAAPWLRQLLTVPLGPALGQCCGGTVRLLLERIGEREAQALADIYSRCDAITRPVASGEPPRIAHPQRHESTGLRAGLFTETLPKLRPALFLYGAGHVGRAIVSAVAPLDLAVTWIDVAADRFPQPVPPTTLPVVAVDPALIARHAPVDAYHLVLTHSHPIDLAICDAVLDTGTHAFLGLIGSETKRARFLSRLRQAGHPEPVLARLTCPIGIASIRGKAPGTIAVAVAAQIAELIETQGTSAMTQNEGEGHARRLSA